MLGTCGKGQEMYDTISTIQTVKQLQYSKVLL